MTGKRAKAVRMYIARWWKTDKRSLRNFMTNIIVELEPMEEIILSSPKPKLVIVSPTPARLQ